MFCSSPECVESQQLSPLVAENFPSEGGSVSLTYTFSKEASGSDEFYWYRQHPGKPPEFLLYHLGSGKILTKQTAGLEIDVKGRNISLLISSAAVTDSAVYYCAVQPTVTGNTRTLDKNLQYSTAATRGPHSLLNH
uniref:Ig-like domain-containing protein n=1 Tax=Poecilia latipinna TaxID=48699 RepID=A0A3B3W2Q3_9TELE